MTLPTSPPMTALTDLAAGRDELIPAFADRLLSGESPLRVYRALRGRRLSPTNGVNRVQIAEIEAGRKSGSVETLRKLADALRVMVDDLV